MNITHSLNMEHLEEASWLYDRQRLFLKYYPSKWMHLEQIDERLDDHIDALVICGAPALPAFLERARDGDTGEGEIHSIVKALCRQNRLDVVEDIIDMIDFSDAERVEAVCRALCQDLPETRGPEFINALFDKGRQFSIIAAHVMAYRRIDLTNRLRDVLFSHERIDDAAEKKVMLSILHAIGRLRPVNVWMLLYDSLLSRDREIAAESIAAIMRTGGPQAFSRCKDVPYECWPQYSAGLYGGRDSLTSGFFSDRAENPGLRNVGMVMDNDRIISAGLIGNLSAIPKLIDALRFKDTAKTAAMSLNLITGAEMYETVFIPDDIDEDMLTTDEKEKLKRGEPLYPKGKEPGRTVTRLSQNPGDWKEWVAGRGRDLNPEIRYRNGKPYSPACLFENMISERSPDLIRNLAREELVIRYGIDVPFETAMPACQQIDFIQDAMERFGKKPGRFMDGKWYLNAELIE